MKKTRKQIMYPKSYEAKMQLVLDEGSHEQPRSTGIHLSETVRIKRRKPLKQLLIPFAN